MQSDAIFSALPSTWRDYLGESMLESVATKCSPRLLEEDAAESGGDSAF